MPMFKNIIAAPADPILGLAEAFKADSRPNKINLGIGVYKDNDGNTPILNSVKQAETTLLANENTKSYLPIDGLPQYDVLTQTLLFGENAEVIQSARAKTSQAVGGTGALRIAAEFLKHQTPVKKIWISHPTWPNHLAIFEAAGIEVAEYRYYDADHHCLDWNNMLTDLSHVQPGDAVLFHGCCHNPTGIDPTPEQWQQLATLSAEQGWLPIFDFAYQGLANGLEEDAFGLRCFTKCHKELLVASSYSKNFGLYNERVGAFTLVAENADIAQRAQSQVKRIIRTLYSNPPYHGAACVKLILSDPTKRQIWEQELTHMRERIKTMRQQLVSGLARYGAKENFDFILEQNGMFSFSGLSPEQVERLKEEFAIYIVRSGRINVAGITPNNIDYLCESIVAIL